MIKQTKSPSKDTHTEQKTPKNQAEKKVALRIAIEMPRGREETVSGRSGN